jgi:hypothetical protein
MESRDEPRDKTTNRGPLEILSLRNSRRPGPEPAARDELCTRFAHTNQRTVQRIVQHEVRRRIQSMMQRKRRKTGFVRCGLLRRTDPWMQRG